MNSDPEIAMRHAGRYAPSPSGDLHKGSLVAALASFLQARAHDAPWYIRVDDLDAQRVVPGAADRILKTLEAYGFWWDGAVMHQSRRMAAYAGALEKLRTAGHVFDCGCTRRQAQQGPPGLEGPIYPGTCRHGMPPGRTVRSMRVRVGDTNMALNDGVQGHYSQNLGRDIGDFVVRRADGVMAYQLATVVDDAALGVTEVVRGADLLPSTPRQMFLHRLLGRACPAYMHIPVLVDAKGRKLGKSNDASPLDGDHRSRDLVEALDLLGQSPERSLAASSVDTVLDWAIAHWRPDAIPAERTIRLGPQVSA